LYAVNLNNKRIYRFDTWNANPQATLTVLPVLPALSNANACNGSGGSGPRDLRPFGLAISATDLYLGFVCAAESSQNRAQDLTAGVFRYNLISGAWAPSSAVAVGLAAFDAQRST